MERLTREETIVVRGKEMAACNYENDDCNDSCRYGRCRWQEKENMLLKQYEDTGLTPEQIRGIGTELKEYKQLELSPKRLSEHVAFCRRYRELFGAIDFNRLMELKERDMPKKIEINAVAPTCPVCGRRAVRCYDFCPDCGQRLEHKEERRWKKNLKRH